MSEEKLPWQSSRPSTELPEPSGQTGDTPGTLIDAVDRQAGKEHRNPAGDRTQSAAQQAYQEQAEQARSPKPAILARDLMTTPIVTVLSDAILVEAWTLMPRRSFRHLPISSVHGTLIGTVSDRNLIRHAPDLVIAGIQSTVAHRRLTEIMSPRVLSATPTTDVREIARVMMDERTGALPILDIDRRLVGITSKQDLLLGLASHGPVELWT